MTLPEWWIWPVAVLIGLITLHLVRRLIRRLISRIAAAAGTAGTSVVIHQLLASLGG